MDTPTSNMIASPAIAKLPEEILLEILAQALHFPNGIHSDRWLHLKKARVDKLLSLPSFAHLVPEALFKYNTLIIKEGRFLSLKTGAMIPSSSCPFVLAYPDTMTAHWVKSLELQISLFIASSYTLETVAMVHYSWLKKLANLELGFDQLETLKIVIVQTGRTLFRNENASHYIHVLPELLRILETRFGAMEFPCKELQLEVLQHTCSDACLLTPGPQCHNYQKLKQLLSATGTTALTIA
ncbi:hypothetical protein PSPO01_09005 [Paraphaeosphaeria sporulosa]